MDVVTGKIYQLLCYNLIAIYGLKEAYHYRVALLYIHSYMVYHTFSISATVVHHVSRKKSLHSGQIGY